MHNSQRIGHERDSELLGGSSGGASYKLYRRMLFHLVQELHRDRCYRCDEIIEDFESFSLDHMKSWRSAVDPRETFFDLDNIAFSHRHCNIGAANGNKTHCPQGHDYTEANTYRYNGGRYCRTCSTERMRIKRRELIPA